MKRPITYAQLKYCNRKWYALLLPLFFLFSLSNDVFAQSANIDQIRNSLLYASPPVSSNTALWVNGNANATQAHYLEGHSIGYRSLLTGLTSGHSYTYQISWETEVSSHMAIDYLTYYRRLEPHAFFGHPAENVDPLIFLNGSTIYWMSASAPTTFPIPAPSTTGTPVSGQPLTSFNALSSGERVMSIYNGNITNLSYGTQDALNSSSVKVSTELRITFTAASDSVVLAWGDTSQAVQIGGLFQLMIQDQQEE